MMMMMMRMMMMIIIITQFMFINGPGKQSNGHLQKQQNEVDKTRTINEAQTKRSQTKQSKRQKLITAMSNKELIIISNLSVAVWTMKVSNSLKNEFALVPQLAAGG